MFSLEFVFVLLGISESSYFRFVLVGVSFRVWNRSMFYQLNVCCWINSISDILQIQVFALVLLEHWWEDLQEYLLRDDGCVDWHQVKVEDDVVTKEHVDQNV